MGAYASVLWVAQTWGTSIDGAIHVINALGDLLYTSVAPF